MSKDERATALFSDHDAKARSGPGECLGMTFESDEERGTSWSRTTTKEDQGNEANNAQGRSLSPEADWPARFKRAGQGAVWLLRQEGLE